MIPKQHYTTAVTRVREGHSAGAVAKELRLIEQTLRNWVKAATAGTLNGVGATVVTPEQMELSRLRAENARLKRKNEILKKRRRTSQGTRCDGRLDGWAAHGLHPGRDVSDPGGERKRRSRMEARRHARAHAADRRTDAGVDTRP